MMIPAFTNGCLRPGARLATVCLAVCLLPACGALTLEMLASDGAYELATPVSGALPQRYLVRPGLPHGKRVRVYLGGDGRPWTGAQPSPVPTGHYQLGLRLFLADPRADAYLGRPCYQVAATELGACESRHWTSERYGEEVVAALAGALQELLERKGAEGLELIGYSGGGTLALLVAARYPMVERVVTVAALLDPERWTAWHGVLPLAGSLSPLHVPREGEFEEWHLLGGRDTVTPPALATSYAGHYPGARFRVLDNFDHRCCWLRHWPALLEQLAAP